MSISAGYSRATGNISAKFPALGGRTRRQLSVGWTGGAVSQLAAAVFWFFDPPTLPLQVVERISHLSQ